MLVDLSRGGDAVYVSTFGDDGRGGILRLSESGIELLDDEPTTGIATTGDRFARLLRAPGERTSATHLVVYDERGIETVSRLDAVHDPHDVAWDGAAWIVVSTGTNEILRLHGNAATALWRGSTAPDAEHVNCVTFDGQQLWATRFGRFDTHKGWRGDAADGRGELWQLDGPGRFAGLTHPHSPRLLADGWLVCDSLRRRVAVLDPTDGTVLRAVELDGYTRGAAVVGDFVLVGVSRHRRDAEPDGSIVWLDAASLAPVARTPIPAREIYDVIVAPAKFAVALRTGFVPGNRVGLFGSGTPQVPLAMLGAAIDPSAARCRIACRRHPDDARLLVVEVENTGGAPVASIEPNPVFLSSRWCRPGAVQVDGDRVALPVVLLPGHRTVADLPIAPPEPGTYVLKVSLVAEHRFWFDDLDPASGWSAVFDVGADGSMTRRQAEGEGPEALMVTGNATSPTRRDGFITEKLNSCSSQS